MVGVEGPASKEEQEDLGSKDIMSCHTKGAGIYSRTTRSQEALSRGGRGFLQPGEPGIE